MAPLVRDCSGSMDADNAQTRQRELEKNITSRPRRSTHEARPPSILQESGPSAKARAYILHRDAGPGAVRGESRRPWTDGASGARRRVRIGERARRGGRAAASAAGMVVAELEGIGPSRRGRLARGHRRGDGARAASRGAAAPGITSGSDRDATLSDQLFRARRVGGQGARHRARPAARGDGRAGGTRAGGLRDAALPRDGDAGASGRARARRPGLPRPAATAIPCRWRSCSPPSTTPARVRPHAGGGRGDVRRRRRRRDPAPTAAVVVSRSEPRCAHHRRPPRLSRPPHRRAPRSRRRTIPGAPGPCSSPPRAGRSPSRSWRSSSPRATCRWRTPSPPASTIRARATPTTSSPRPSRRATARRSPPSPRRRSGHGWSSTPTTSPRASDGCTARAPRA